MLDNGANNDEGFLERVSKGTVRVISGVCIIGKCVDVGTVPLGHSTRT